MYAHHFADLLKGWLTAAEHPGITRVRTCAEIGRWEQPIGVVLDLTDGWRFVLQVVGTAPAGGDRERNPDPPPPKRFDGRWENRDDYQQARRRFEAEALDGDGPKPRKPQATVTSLLAVVLDAVKRADHAEVSSVEIPDDRPVLLVTCDDGSKVYGLPVGYITPGATDLAHEPHKPTKEWL